MGTQQPKPDHQIRQELREIGDQTRSALLHGFHSAARLMTHVPCADNPEILSASGSGGIVQSLSRTNELQKQGASTILQEVPVCPTHPHSQSPSQGSMPWRLKYSAKSQVCRLSAAAPQIFLIVFFPRTELGKIATEKLVNNQQVILCSPCQFAA